MGLPHIVNRAGEVCMGYPMGHDVDPADYATIVYSDEQDEDTLLASKAYTDEKVLEVNTGGGITLDGYATIVQMEEADTAVLEAAKEHTNSSVSAVFLDPTRSHSTLVNTDRPLYYIGSGTPADHDGLDQAAVASQFNSTTDEGVWIKDSTGWRKGGDTEGLASEDYVQNADELVLNSAKAYTDQQITALVIPDPADFPTAGDIADGDAATLAAANAYTDTEAIDALPEPEAPDLDGYATEEHVATEVAAGVNQSKAYTDEKILEVSGGGEISLDGYATVDAMEAGDTASVAAAAAYTDEQIGGLPEPPSLDGYATVDAVEAGDTASVTAAKTYTDEQIGNLPEPPSLDGLATVDAMEAGDTASVAAAAVYTDQAIDGLPDAPDLSGLATTAAMEAGDTETLSSAKTYTDQQIGNIPEPPSIDGLATTAAMEAGDTASVTAAKTYTDQQVGGIDAGDGLTTAQVQALIDAAKPRTYADLAGVDNG